MAAVTAQPRTIAVPALPRAAPAAPRGLAARLQRVGALLWAVARADGELGSLPHRH